MLLPLGTPMIGAGVQVLMQDSCWTCAASRLTAVTSIWIQREQIPRDLTYWEQTMQGVAAAQRHLPSPLHQGYAASMHLWSQRSLGVLHA